MKRFLILVVPVLLSIAPGVRAQEPVVSKPDLDLTGIRRLPVLEGQRYKPLDSMAREWIEQITDKETFQKTDPVLLLLFLRCEPEKAREAKIIKLPGYRAAKTIGFEPEAGAEHVSYDQLAASRGFRDRLEEIDAKHEKARSESDQEIMALHTRFSMVGEFAGLERSRYSGSPHLAGFLPCIPPVAEPKEGVPYSWASPAELERTGHPAERSTPVAAAFESLRQSFRANDGKTFGAAAEDLMDACASLGYPKTKDLGFPGMARLDREIRFNLTAPFKKAAWYFYLPAMLIALVAAVVFPRSRVAWILALAPLAVGLGYHGWGLAERTILSGRAMIGTFYESMLFAAAAAALGGFILELVFRNRWMVMSGATLGFSALFVATTNPDFMRPAISNLMPVLINNDWIHIHVPTIMTSYAVLGLAAVLGHVYLFKYLFAGDRSAGQKNLAKTLFWTIPPGVTLLFAGIILGGVWADASWGRFWGWDPKEVGALIMWLVFMVIVHGRWAGWLRDFGTALGTVVGGWSLAWSYYGTNFFWKGLHSYASASGGVEFPPWMLWGTSIEVLFVAAAVFMWFRKQDSMAAAAVAEDAGPEVAVSATPSPATR